MYKNNFIKFLLFNFAMGMSLNVFANESCASTLSQAFYPLINVDIKTVFKENEIYLEFEKYCMSGDSVCVRVQIEAPDVNRNVALQTFEVDPKSMKIYDITIGLEVEEKIDLKFNTDSFSKVYECLIK